MELPLRLPCFWKLGLAIASRQRRKTMSGLLQTKVGDIDDRELLDLIDELEQACRVGSREFISLPLMLFLTQCASIRRVRPKRVPITTKYAASTPLLESRVGKRPDGPLRDLCGELAVLSAKSLESFSGSKVYVLLNETLPKNLTATPPGATQSRWDAVVYRRRSNR